MTGQIGDIKAKCPSCGETAFESSTGSEPKPEDMLTCCGCGRVWRCDDLAATLAPEGKKLVDEMARNIVENFNRRK